MDINTRKTCRTSPMVVEGGRRVGGDVVSSGRARISGFHGRVHKRMGRIMRRSKLARKMASSRASYKLAGNEDGTCSPPNSPVSPTTESSADLDRQLHYSGVSEEGGTRSQALLRISHRILKSAYDLQIRLYPQHIAGHLNVLADLASRTGQVIPLEWAVATPTFRWICERSPWGPPEVDLFANSRNHRLRCYVSPCPDPEACAMDALTCSWPRKVAYAFPRRA